MELEEMSVKDLQAKLIGLGMPEDDVAAFKSKAPLIASIRMLENKPEVKEESKEEPKKVASIIEPPSPKEDREVNKKWKSKAEAMRERLMAQPKVSIMIPIDVGSKEKVGVVEWREDKSGKPYQVHISGAIETVTLNGYKTMIPKGVYYPVPQQVAEVISKSQNQTMMAGAEFAIDRVKDEISVKDVL